MAEQPVNARTHLRIDPRWSGAPIALGEGEATVVLATLPEMAADDRGLVHGGFVFSLADYAAMLAVNDPHVVLGAAEVRFVAPVRVGLPITALARTTAATGRKRTVEVVCKSEDREVFRGTFTVVVLDRHVLDEGSR